MIIFEKSKRNLKLVEERIKKQTIASRVGYEEPVFLAIGGYYKTYDLLLAMGADKDDIATYNGLNLTNDMLVNTHYKQILLLRKSDYITYARFYDGGGTKRFLDLNKADGLESQIMVYLTAQRLIGRGKNQEQWVKPTIVILDDPLLNLQFDGYRFKYAPIGFCQPRNPNADPYEIIKDIKSVEVTKKMMFARYIEKGVDEKKLLDALSALRGKAERNYNGDNGLEWWFKPTEYKRIVGSNEIANALKDEEELGIWQYKSNKKYGRENARWVVVPDSAFDFQGFDYKDEDQEFLESLEREEQAEQAYIKEQEQKLEEILQTPLSINYRQGYTSNEMGLDSPTSLQEFLDGIEEVAEDTNAIALLDGVSTPEEYEGIKKHTLVYFLDGLYKQNTRLDKNFLGGKRLISIDIDEGDYTREQLEDKLETQDLFGLVFPTPRYYLDGSNRWRIVLMTDDEVTDKEHYRSIVTGVGELLDIEIDEASKKLSQLMGYPLKREDVSIVTGTMVSIDQFKTVEKKSQLTTTSGGVVHYTTSDKSLLDFNHPQARLIKQALKEGIAVGYRNNYYRQMIMFLNDTKAKEDFSLWHEEADQIRQKLIHQMELDGLAREEINLICRPN